MSHVILHHHHTYHYIISLHKFCTRLCKDDVIIHDGHVKGCIIQKQC